MAIKSIKSMENELLPGLKFLIKKNRNLLGAIAIVFGFAMVGTVMIVTSKAATYAVPKELEAGTPAGAYSAVSDTNASGGQYIKFGVGGGTTPPTTPPPSTGGGSREDTICGGSFKSAVGGSTEDIPAPASGKTLTVGSGKQYSSLSSALGAASAGDNIVIDPGNYSETGNFTKGGSSGKCITIAGNGGKAIFKGGGKFSGSYIRLINITVANSGGFALNSSGVSNISIHNFEVNGSQDGGLYFTNSSKILVDGCDVHGTNGRGTSAAGEALSIADGTTDSEVRYCKVHDNGEEGIDVKYSNNKSTNVKIHDNWAYSNRGPNVYIDGVNGVDVYNNRIYSTTNTSKPGLMFGCEGQYAPATVSKNINVYNNIIYNNLSAGIGHYTESGGSISGVTIYNNTVVGNKGGLDLSGVGSVKTYNNIIVGGGGGSSDFTSDPGFVGGDDYHLKPGSAAIDKATGTPAPTFDADNKPRPQGAGIDYGAYDQ